MGPIRRTSSGAARARSKTAGSTYGFWLDLGELEIPGYILLTLTIIILIVIPTIFIANYICLGSLGRWRRERETEGGGRLDDNRRQNCPLFALAFALVWNRF